jgi:hypothetical protein
MDGRASGAESQNALFHRHAGERESGGNVRRFTTASVISSPTIWYARHFRVLNEIVASEAGAVVKTIGDAVMATFPTKNWVLTSELVEFLEFVRIIGIYN